MVKVSFSKNNTFNVTNILASWEYLSTKSDICGYFFDDNFVLPFFIDRHLIFKRLIFTTSLINLKDGLSIDMETDFLNSVSAICKEKKICDVIYKPQSNVFFNTYPDNSDYIPWGTYETDITKSYESLLMSFDGKHRNVIRKAIKDGVITYATMDVDLVYTNIRETLERQNSIHYPSLDYLKKLKKLLPHNILFYCASYKNNLQGTAIIIFDNKTAYYMYGGSIQCPHIGSINLLQYNVMIELSKLGVERYDFVGARIPVVPGSKYEGIQRFKSRFGSTLKRGFVFRVVVNPNKYKLFIFLVKLFSRIRGSVFKEPIDEIKEDMRRLDESTCNI